MGGASDTPTKGSIPLDTLISNVTAVTMNPKMEVLFGAYIGIEDGKITYLAKTAPKEQPSTIIDGTGMVAIPGLINCHTHLATSVLRSYTDDLTGNEALEALLQKEAKMDSRSAKAAALLSIAECLRFGVTSVSDLYYYPNATAEAVAQSGIKANLALSSYRFIDETRSLTLRPTSSVRSFARSWTSGTATTKAASKSTRASTPNIPATIVSGKVWRATPVKHKSECSCI